MGDALRACRVRLLPRGLLVKTGPVDFAEWNSRPLVGWIMRQRFRMALSLLPSSVGRLLEVGYGSGVFMPELARRAQELSGIDIHDHQEEVARALASINIIARLHKGSAEAMPFEDGIFDAIGIVSALEFIPDLPDAVDEFVRILAPSGIMVVVIPAHSPLADAGLRLLTGRRAEADFQGRRQRVMPALLSKFQIDRAIYWPMRSLALYTALRLRPRVNGAERDDSESA
jgi:ubiquinone/menaquinone biosynthesis C-methylase UbiE